MFRNSQKKNNLIFFPIVFFFIIFFYHIKILLLLDFSNQIYASTFSVPELQILESKLKIAARNISNIARSQEKKVVITVIDFLNFETQASGLKGYLLEEQFTELLYAIIPEQVIPNFEIVSLRLEWKSRYPEFHREPLTEDIIKLTGADWVVTGTYEQNIESVTVKIQLFDLVSENLIWDTILKGEKTKNKFTQNLTSIDYTNTNYNEENFQKFDLESFDESIIFSSKDDLETPEGMVKIPEGEFVMGSDYGYKDELPDHIVFIKSFFIDKYEVTNLDFNRCFICERGTGIFDSKEPTKPVIYVDWSNADSFCKSQNKRLPTEAEWEYAARAGRDGDFNFGGDINFLESIAWMETNTADLDLWGAKAVGGKKSNKWGLFDMQGNVMEWVKNYYKPDYFDSVRQNKNPQGPVSPMDEKYPLRVVRGGAWGGMNDAGTPGGIRPSKRYAFVEWTRSFQIGFRCARDIN